VSYSILKSSRGFTYIGALVLVVILGIMLGAAAQSWTMVMKREREAELLFRGGQIRDALEKWYKPVAGRQPVPLRDLKDLLLDPNSVSKIKYLRRDPTKEYNDPITGKAWSIVRDPAMGGIIGVASTSNDEPLKQDFSDYPKDSIEFKTFKGKTKYSEWVFVPAAYQSKIASLKVGAGSLPTPGSSTPGSITPGSTPGGSAPPLPTPAGR
jgi:type II secretory pathway pseudopilin PulG